MVEDSNVGPKDKYSSKRWIGCPTEEEYFGEERKAGKKARKIAKAGDRSKYKKTDRDKIEKAREMPSDDKHARTDLQKGMVLSVAPEGVTVRSPEGDLLCVLRGILKKEKKQLKSLVVIGDHVLFERLSPEQGAIVQIEPRKTVLSRADNLSRRKEQLIAANIDQVIITGSVVSPPLKPPLLDRYVIAARMGGLEPLIVINKIDLLDSEDFDEGLRESERELYEHLIKAYAEANIPVIGVSSATGVGIDLLSAAMKDKSSVFSGQSGVGKSSLINSVTGSDLKVGVLVDRTQKGSHTTSTARLLPLEFGGWCVDTPGIKSFGVWDLKKEEIEGYFSEIHRYGRECRFPDCVHLHEEDCAVRKAVEEGKISLIRYYSYQSLLISSSEEYLRR
jgi:ribosome biogenesis GTPase